MRPFSMKRSNGKRIAILGGGVAGVVLAQQLARDPSLEVHLLEKTSRLGGLHRSVEIGGAHYDIGAFFFVRQHSLLQCFPAIVDLMVPLTDQDQWVSVTPKRTFDRYPVSLGGYVRDYGLPNFIASAFDLAARR